MRLLYEAEESYAEDMEALVRLAYSVVPREHVRELDGVYVVDFDPKGNRLGVYERNHLGNRITLFLWPHLLDIERVAPEHRRMVLALHLGHTLFHEVGHHVTLTLNRRRAPSKKRGQVTDTLEKWAEQYVEKRMERLKALLTPPSEPPVASA